LPFGNGSFPTEWKPGTFPLGIRPIIAFNDDLWMTGQKSAWSSTDGIKWTPHAKTDWGERISTASIWFRGKLWVFGGISYNDRRVLNESWFSSNGTNWEKAKNAEWPARKGHSVIFFKNKLWVFGGAATVLPDFTTDKLLNDVWSSEDGIHWKEEINAAPWPARETPGLLVFKDTLYLLGGQGQADVWRSSDGKNWAMLTREAEWQKRSDNGSLVFDNKMWIFGGRDTNSNHNLAAKNDVWYSENGIKWIKQAGQAPWTVRSGGTSVVFKDQLWIFSGKHTGGKYNWGGDVWVMRRAK
jgi:N-acetylneuraminic acid mutarotase